MVRQQEKLLNELKRAYASEEEEHGNLDMNRIKEMEQQINDMNLRMSPDVQEDFKKLVAVRNL